MEELISFLFFYSSVTSMSPELLKEMDEFINEMEDVLNIKLQDGYNRNSPCMKAYFDPVICDHRLLAVYLGVEFLDLLVYVYLRSQGF